MLVLNFTKTFLIIISIRGNCIADTKESSELFFRLRQHIVGAYQNFEAHWIFTK